MRIVTLGGLAALFLMSGAALAQLPGVAAARLEQAPKPNSAAPLYRQTGEQYRVYEFPGTGEPIPYRLFVPEFWTPEQKLPVLITLRAGNSINNNHRGGNELVKLARERGYIVISPLGYRGLTQPYYGSPYPVDREAGPSKPADGWSPQDNQRAELDVLYVLNLVAAEYNADTSRVFLHGQNPSGSAAFHFAAQYPDLFKAIVVSAGPIISTSYPFEKLKGKVAVLLLTGDKDARYTAAASERMKKELQQHGVDAEFHLVPDGEHMNAYLLDAPRIFDFLDQRAAKTAGSLPRAGAAASTQSLLAAQADRWDKAIVARNRAAIEANMAEDFRQIDGSGAVVDRATFIRDLVDPDLTLDPYTVEDFGIRVYGDTALLSGRMRMTGRYQGKPFDSHYRYIDTYVRQDGVWKVVSVQLTRVTQ